MCIRKRTRELVAMLKGEITRTIDRLNKEEGIRVDDIFFEN